MKTKYISFFLLFLTLIFQAQRSPYRYYYEYDKYDLRNKPLDLNEKKLFAELFGDRRSQDFMKEKIYAQTDHVFYRPGESLYFKAFIVNSQNNLPSDWSQILYAELYDPAGNRVAKLKYQIENGSSAGDYQFSEKAKGGIYKLRFFTNWMRNENHKNYFEKEITVQKTSSPRILMKLDFPKKGLSAGEEVTADFSLRNLQNLPIPYYEGTYEILTEGKEYLKKSFITDREGNVQLKFNLPEKLASADVLLNIKLNYNSFQESILRSVPVTLNQIEILFFPEGGSLINGKETFIAFKALNEFQQPVDIKAEIVNEKGGKISETESAKFGMGKFSFLPIHNQKFFLKLTSHKISKLYQIPEGKDEGISLNVNKKNGKIGLKIQSQNHQKVIVEAAFRGEIIETKEDVPTNTEIEFDENIFPSGIARFTVFDVSKNPLAERVVFVNKDQNVQISIKPDKTEYLPREKVIFDIETKDATGKPIASNLSMSVLDDKLYSYADDRQNTLISWLQMDSELQGKIEEPPFYFKKEEEKADEALDLVMLTNGYRYFELNPAIQKKGTFPYQKEELNSIYGKIENEKGEAVDADVFMISGNSELVKQQTKKGRFYFRNFPSGNGSYELVAKSKKRRQKVYIKLLASQISSDFVTQKVKSKSSDKEFEALVSNPIAEDYKEDQADKEQSVSFKPRGRRIAYMDSTKTKDVEEVVILGYSAEREKKSLSSYVQITKVESLLNNVPNALQGKIAGLEITQNSGNPGNSATVVVRGVSSISNGKQPLVVVDGIPTDYPNFKINTDNISTVTVLKDASATAIYGSRGSNGVIIITTLNSKYYKNFIDLHANPFFAYKTLNEEDLITTSYSRTFKYPVYETPVTNYRTDFRETIYWNPTIQTDKNGKAKVEFFNSDANTTFRAIAEGISANGLLGREEKTYSAQSRLQMDAKIPPYLTQGDQPIINVIFKNNSDKTKTISFNKILPNSIKNSISDSLITLNAKESGKIILPLTGNKVLQSNIQLIAETDTEKERQILPFNVEAKGFVHYYENYTDKDSTITFTIPDYLDESMTSKIQIFRDTSTQLLNDIDKLKEKPHGCFEQTSSTTYPNYFILKYLQSKGNIDNRDAGKATELLKSGFERLLTFETKDKGFSLFGSSPPSITLTAYGLMEFNDLKNVLNVSPALIERTSKFILSRRDGKGNFVLNYNSKTDDIKKDNYYWSQQAYILYALSEVGMKSEIIKEYEHLFRNNQSSGDFYVLAMMSNIAFQLNKTRDFDFLVKKMKEQFNKNEVVAETNFMQGRGDGIKKEALSMFALALMKSNNRDKALLAKLINQIDQKNDYYMSTQTLVIKLKALTEFYKLNPKAENAGEPKIFVNDNAIQSDLKAAQFLKKGKNEIKVKYPLGGGFPILFSHQLYNLVPDKNPDPELYFTTMLNKTKAKIGDNVRMTVKIDNPTNKNFGMMTAKIGIPAGLTMDPKNLKAMMERNEIAYYEIFDNYLVLYWYNLDFKKNIQVNLDTKAEFAGKYTGKANHAFEYYNQQNYQWTDGVVVEISE